ncbi:alpha/beta hydrolase [Streptomyces sp. NPDC051577]|uniref:alpha/beta fold hydrolase n=1 Tax=Streptomyces sp. NPDC051577 TaxID=3155166 RepID=UPI00341F2CB5
MPTFRAPDGTRLAYRVVADRDPAADPTPGLRPTAAVASTVAPPTAAPIVCVPGGPADSRYLGDLGGLSAHRPLIVSDLRGTGRSAVPEDTSSYRCDRLVDDVEALRVHLGLPRMTLLGHSAGANIATQYAARYPDRLDRLVLVGPGTRAVGLTIHARTRRELALLRRDEPWFPTAFAALEAIMEGTGGDTEAVAPFFHGRWDDQARRHHEAGRPDNEEAVALFGAEGAFTPESTRAALAALEAPALLLVGEFDLNSPPASVAEFAALFPDARLVVQPGAGHHPWIDDPDRFAATLAAFTG